MSALTLLPLLIASTALAGPEAAKLFTDKGSLYFRTDTAKLTVGAELTVVAAETSVAPVGKAVIMEVSGKLARVSLDDDATKAGAKFVLVPKPKGAGVAATPNPANSKPTGPKLNGTVESGTLRVTIANNSDTNWSACELMYSDGSTYKLGEMVKHSDDTVLKVKFASAREPLYDHLIVSCSEGESRFYFSKPTAPAGNLKGYAVNGNLKGHANDSINGGRFKKEAEAPISWLDLRCKEGWLRQPL